MHLARRYTLLAVPALLAVALVACLGDDDELSGAALQESYDELSAAINEHHDIVDVPSDERESIIENCEEVAASTDSDAIDDFCDNVVTAADNTDQTLWGTVRLRFEDMRGEFEQAVAEAASGDTPLQGGDDQE